MWLASQVAPFVCGDTGSIRDLDHVLWGIRMTVLVQLVHWKLRASGAWTVTPPEPAAQEVARVRAAVPRQRGVQL